jgi:light-regulated signal transduction histidine kinase (bacteriophytochrome)
VLAHELRSHLAAIALASSHLGRRLTDSTDDPHVAQALKTIDNAARQAMELTAWVLASAPKPLPQPFAGQRPAQRVNRHIDVVQIVRDVVGDLGLIVPTREVRINAAGEVAGNGDDVRIRAILTNVILSAARRAGRGAAIDIEVEQVSRCAHVTITTPDWEPSQTDLDEMLRPFTNHEAAISLDVRRVGGADDRGAGRATATATAYADEHTNKKAVVLRLPLGPVAGRSRLPRQSHNCDQ